MKHASTSIEIDAPSERVWALIAEFRHWPEWGPTVRSVRSEFGAVAPGVRGSIQTPVGVWLPFEITSVTSGESWSWRVGGVEATGHQVAALGDDRSRLTFTVPIVFAPYVVVLRRGLRRVKGFAEAARS